MKKLEVFCYSCGSFIAGRRYQSSKDTFYEFTALTEEESLNIFQQYILSKYPDAHFSIITANNSRIAISPEDSNNFLDF